MARWVISVFGLCLLGRGAGAGSERAPIVDFSRVVWPILSNHCFACHGPDAGKREAGLRLDTHGGILGASSSGLAVVVPGDPSQSELVRRITADDPDTRMPPGHSPKPLAEKQIEVLTRWIQEGAAWRAHWAYGAPKRPPVPKPPSDSANDSHPIDSFLAAKLLEAGLTPAPPADKVTLIRRLSFDLTGLPPNPAEVDVFLADDRTEATAELVERLLASPHFGERMAVYWLDLVRYADSCGYHSDVDQPIWPYRDYVIAAFNRNLSFDQFTREQIAGDLLPSPTLEQRVATGYNRLNKTTEEGGAQEGEYRAKSAADRVRTTAGAWLAATLGCAECHDHKFDPYTARDFYGFAAFFADIDEKGVYSAGGRDPVLAVPSPEQAARLESLAREIADIGRQLAALKPSEPEPTRKELEKRKAALDKERKRLEASIPRTMVTVSVTPRETRVLPRGNWLDHSGPVVQPSLPAFLASDAKQSDSLTRLDLADWLVSPDNPLVARVFVNRLWKLLFGAGLARNLDDMGSRAEPPTHPELLDWLAVEFVVSDWDVKHMIRLMTTSNAYQRSSVPTAEVARIDPSNRLFGRQGRWRLEAEFIRDLALASSGLLVRRVGGPSVKPYQPDGYWDFLNFPKRTWKADRGPNQYRRGLYTHWQRTFLHPSLLAFDATSREECTAERAVSNTPKAALALLNDPTFVEAARMLATRALRETLSSASHDSSDEPGIEWMWRQVLSREPQARELELLTGLLVEERARFASDPAAAARLLSVGLSPVPADFAAPELAAWTAVARAILNLGESVTRN